MQCQDISGSSLSGWGLVPTMPVKLVIGLSHVQHPWRADLFIERITVDPLLSTVRFPLLPVTSDLPHGSWKDQQCLIPESLNTTCISDSCSISTHQAVRILSRLTALGLGDTFKWPSMLGSKELSTKNACALAMILPRPYQKEEKKGKKNHSIPAAG